MEQTSEYKFGKCEALVEDRCCWRNLIRVNEQGVDRGYVFSKQRTETNLRRWLFVVPSETHGGLFQELWN